MGGLSSAGSEGQDSILTVPSKKVRRLGDAADAMTAYDGLHDAPYAPTSILSGRSRDCGRTKILLARAQSLEYNHELGRSVAKVMAVLEPS